MRHDHTDTDVRIHKQIISKKEKGYFECMHRISFSLRPFPKPSDEDLSDSMGTQAILLPSLYTHYILLIKEKQIT